MTSNCEVFDFAHQQLAVDYTEATVEWKQWVVMTEDCDSGTGKTVKLQAIRRLCIRLLVIMLNTVDELTNLALLTSQNFYSKS